MPRLLAGTSVAGEGMRERLRTTTFALFGLVTAVGLVLVGIAYNQGWPDFADSPIPGIPIERVGEATIAAEAVHTKAHPGNGPASQGSAPVGQADIVPDRSSDLHVSSQHQLPTTVPDGQVPGQAPPGQGGAAAPGSPAPAPAPQAADQPPAAESPAPDPPPTQRSAPVATSPPRTAATVPGNGKAKGHEKSEKSKSAGPPPAVPTVPSVPPAPTAPAQETTAPSAEGPGNGHGKGNANGHFK